MISLDETLEQQTKSGNGRPVLSEKFVRYYMRLAKFVGSEVNSCYSRQIGSVIVDVKRNQIISTGYNGPPAKCPNVSSREYLEKIVLPQITPIEKHSAIQRHSRSEVPRMAGKTLDNTFLDAFEASCLCPRKILGYESGERAYICPCQHSEANAINRAAAPLHECWIFCWCPLPCYQCSGMIINSGIKKVFCLKNQKDYSYSSRWLLEKASVEIDERPQEYYEK